MSRFWASFFLLALWHTGVLAEIQLGAPTQDIPSHSTERSPPPAAARRKSELSPRDQFLKKSPLFAKALGEIPSKLKFVANREDSLILQELLKLDSSFAAKLSPPVSKSKLTLRGLFSSPKSEPIAPTAEPTQVLAWIRNERPEAFSQLRNQLPGLPVPQKKWGELPKPPLARIRNFRHQSDPSTINEPPKLSVERVETPGVMTRRLDIVEPWWINRP